MSTIAAQPYTYVKNWKERTGGRVFGYFCSYFPEELLHAAGVLPMRILGDKENVALADSHIQAFICSLVRTSLDAALKKKLEFLDGVVFPHSCDSIQNLADIWRYNFPEQFSDVVVLPVWVDVPEAEQYLAQEISRFKSKFERHLGRQIAGAELSKSLDIYNENRSALAALYALRRDKPNAISGQTVLDIVKASMYMRKEDHTALLQEALEELRSVPRDDDQSVRLVLYGNVCDDPGIMHLFEELEAVVVDDDLCTGSRYFLHIEPSDGDPIRRLAQRYLRKIPCPSKHSSDFDRRTYLVNMVRQSKADGVVILLLKFCDPHAFDYPDISKRLTEDQIPHLLIETEIQPASIEQTRTRLQAFVEMLKEKKNG
ncbi:MAG: 2-hydroxyacyl-CoA dehydratase [Candidatus Abyssobacteria bacterium SURF_5]|uniref:2-hydroxyacyl-CoA dehydratase n=1 Tax=Abyssobacteria bacterium (strain SURF_5) TaxID=2093360 RepID=A0A3A4NS85_ABYX5|nr:MAG: 2-hydroxyacyl-CoA dehydratase [Candidatus Abyssubacteria bacterium SURF_5]